MSNFTGVDIAIGHIACVDVLVNVVVGIGTGTCTGVDVAIGHVASIDVVVGAGAGTDVVVVIGVGAGHRTGTSIVAVTGTVIGGIDCAHTVGGAVGVN